ncbi:MAG: SMP-30/gluconolactonase/LRE family protein [candidate division KSB1 bacterium]|nr:SMP-30/gluconolactonase/LRE family protein [candidate division KSB1 bacterium]
MKRNTWFKFTTVLTATAAVLLIMCGSVAEVQFPIDVGEKPESITKGFNGNYYVTLMDGNEPEDGEIVELAPGVVRTFSTNFNDPKGIVYLNNHLYVSDVTKIWEIDANGVAGVWVDQMDFPHEVLYLNDVAVDENGTGIYVTDMGASNQMWDQEDKLWPLDSDEAAAIPVVGRVYHVDLDGNVTIAQDTSDIMLNPNGVNVNNDGKLLIGAFFLGNLLVQEDGDLTQLPGAYRGADGVAQDSQGNYYISSWAQGTLWKMDAATGESTVLVDTLQSAADFYLEEDKGRLLLPDMKAGTVYEIKLP